MFKKNCRIRNGLTNALIKALNCLPNVQKEGEGKRLNNVIKNPTELGFWGIPLTSCCLECHVQIFIKYWITLNLSKYSHIHLCQPQAVYGRVQPRHSNLPCSTWPCRSGLSICNKPLKIHPTRKQILWWTSFDTLQKKHWVIFSTQVTNLNVLLPEAFTPRVRNLSIL